MWDLSTPTLQAWTVTLTLCIYAGCSSKWKQGKKDNYMLIENDAHYIWILCYYISWYGAIRHHPTFLHTHWQRKRTTVCLVVAAIRRRAGLFQHNFMFFIGKNQQLGLSWLSWIKLRHRVSVALLNRSINIFLSFLGFFYLFILGFSKLNLNFKV